MSELRYDPTSNISVVIAPERGRRPHARGPRPEQRERPSSFDPTCPFCPGNESMLPAIIAETTSVGRPGWRTRDVANKFPAFSHDSAPCAHSSFYEASAVQGCHDVIIESPQHNNDLTTMSQDRVRDVLAIYRNRFDALMAEEAVQSVIVFRNRGKIAGASLQHPHSQIIGLEIIPPLVQARQTAMLDYYKA
ncbi:MAG: DUF4931 domain-containing protein, partial [Methylocystis sp.]